MLYTGCPVDVSRKTYDPIRRCESLAVECVVWEDGFDLQRMYKTVIITRIAFDCRASIYIWSAISKPLLV